MARCGTPPFRADHVGSLLRPPELLLARGRFQQGALTAGELRVVENDAIRAAVALQEEVGLQAATDGKLRRQSWQGDFLGRLGGVTLGTGQPSFPYAFHTDAGETRVPTLGSVSVTGRIRLEETIFGEEFATLRSLATTALPKLTIPSPNMVFLRTGRPGSTSGSTRISRSSGPTSSPPTGTSWPGCTRSAAPTSRSTTSASRCSTIPTCACSSPSAARTPTACTCSSSGA